jgi:NAD(P)-dependent dehydrogenase (short-subunit alcohol dehydrogenase family)
MLQLRDRIAIVTGAGQGIGFGIAQALGHEGAWVIVGELALGRRQEAAARLAAEGIQAQALPLDVTQPASCAALAEQVLAEHGRIDVLVNNAGAFILHPSEDTPEADWRKQVDVLLNGVFFMTQAVARAAMIPQQRGSVVNIASIGGMGGWPLRAAYNAAKAGVIVLTETLAVEWAHYNIRLNCVSPGVTRTEMMQTAIRLGIASETRYANRIPLGRVAEVPEIARAVLFLASDRASFVTGENVVVDGGWVPWGNMNGLGYPEHDV